MIDLYYWPTPNGHKITLFLEEANLSYQIKPVDILTGDQFKPEFLKISPNNRIPAIVDHKPAGGARPISVFESGAILVYLAEKTNRFLSKDFYEKYETLQWLFWQMGGLGPMAGQNNHFNHYAPEKIPYAMERYINETSRLFRVLNKRLEDREFVAGKNYSVADIAIYPWIVLQEKLSQKISEFVHLERWMESIKKRPATIKAYQVAESVSSSQPQMDEQTRKVLFGQK